MLRSDDALIRVFKFIVLLGPFGKFVFKSVHYLYFI